MQGLPLLAKEGKMIQSFTSKMLKVALFVSVLANVWAFGKPAIDGTVSMTPVGEVDLRLEDGGRVTTTAYKLGRKYMSCSEVMNDGGRGLRLSSLGKLNMSSPEASFVPKGIGYWKSYTQ